MSGKLSEILSSGQAPGFITGQAKDPHSVISKAPKALRELESTPRFKHGPNHGAAGIAKHFSMPVDFIKKTWEKPFKAVTVLFAMLSVCLSSLAGPINTGVTFQQGGTYNAQDFNNAINNATVNYTLISGLAIDATPLQTDYIMVYSPTLGTFLWKSTLSAAFFNNPADITSLPFGQPVYTNADLVPFYSVNGTNKEAVYYSQLVQNIATNILPANLRFMTNNPYGSTNNFTMQNYFGILSGLVTNGQPYTLFWNGTNGLPYQVAMSNLESSLAFDLGTNYEIPQIYQNVFTPWTIQTTNPFANSWGYTSIQPITNILNVTNGVTDFTPTLTNNDTIPVFAHAQGSNTTMTLNALVGYLNSINALPNYTQARVQFSGIPIKLIITNNANTTYNSISVSNAANYFKPSTAYPSPGIPYAVSFITNGTGFYFPNAQSNQVYYVDAFATNANWVQVYTNYYNALAQTNQINITATGSGLQWMVYLTNFTSLNADPIAVTFSQSIVTGSYQVWFRTPAATNAYYLSGSVMSEAANPGNTTSLNIDGAANIITTNNVQVRVVNGGDSSYQPPLVHVLISPQ